MSDRYITTGVVADLRGGKSVIYYASRVEVDELFRACMGLVDRDEVTRVVRTFGRQRIDHRNGGSLRFIHSNLSLRGAQPDVLVLSYEKDADGQIWHEIQNVLAGGGTEIIRT